MDGLSLRVENPVLQRDEDARFHVFACRFVTVPPL
jgi:hypothetical protein